MLTDTRIIARQSAQAGAIEVIAQRHEVMLMDCQPLWMHHCMAHGLPLHDQRALQAPDGRLLLVQLDRLAKGLELAVRQSPVRDVPGVILYTLRGLYPKRDTLLAVATRVATGTWWPVDGAPGYTWQAAPRAVDPALARMAA